MKPYEFTDILYGKIKVPTWLLDFIRTPEFARLRGVRLSNVDSFQYKDFSGPSRWEHGIAVASLAWRCAIKKNLDLRDTVHLILAGLLHDIATPPFGHTAEYVLENYDHELESQNILQGADPNGSHVMPIYASQLPQFHKVCNRIERSLNVKIEPSVIAGMIVGDGELGYLIKGSIDLDNADNVMRACLYLGIRVEREVPVQIADYLAAQEHRPVNLNDIRVSCVEKWLDYRDQLYQHFFKANTEELGRQAFLQHILRTALASGISRDVIIRSTDESLLEIICNREKYSGQVDIHEITDLVQRYRLLETPIEIAKIAIDNSDWVKLLSPNAIHWIENELKQYLDVFILLNKKRFEKNSSGEIFEWPGVLHLFKLGKSLKLKASPEWFASGRGETINNQRAQNTMETSLKRQMEHWIRERPWASFSPERQTDLVQKLSSNGNWGFKLSRNDSLHPYPSTFVHAIPATVIATLGLKGGLLMDPFGGTGQTAVEAIKLSCRVITSDISSIATLAAKAKLNYLSQDKRDFLHSVINTEFHTEYLDVPQIENIHRWFHENTLGELTEIRSFIRSQEDPDTKLFLMNCFSAILPACTDRHGLQHGFFADNTPLKKGKLSPEYRDAKTIFKKQLKKNLDIIEKFYSDIIKSGNLPETELNNAKIYQLDARYASAEDYGIYENSVDGIITSPPYLCASDYVLGQRLSYYWLDGFDMDQDFARELGARRSRFRPAEAYENYIKGLGEFAAKAKTILKHKGYLVTVMAAPVSQVFRELNLIAEFDNLLDDNEFTKIWEIERPIHWHRNFRYAKIKSERIAVHVLK